MWTEFCCKAKYKAGFIESYPDLFFSKSDIDELKKLTIHQQICAGEGRAPKIIPFLDRLKHGSAVEVFEELLNTLSIAYNKKSLRYIGFSEAWCDDFIFPLLKQFEKNIKCIHIVRDPRAIVASRNASKRDYRGKYPILFLIRHWRKTASYSIINRDNPSYMMVRLEDIYSSPETWIKKICDHLNIEFTEKLLDFESFVNGEGKKWEPNTNFDRKRQFPASSHGIWEEVLKDSEKGFIEWLCKPEMDYLGYRKSIEDYSLNDLTAYVENKEEIKEWLKPYDLSVNEKQISIEIVRRNLFEFDGYISEDLKDYLFVNSKVYNVLKGC
jgi:hypothetical protein|tara:strand:+ start:1153 stop:2130 length:978 start_codon:yes stop_codon:yes gene_type:complete